MKKGFTLIELLVSLIILSLVVVFISSFVLNLRDEKGSVVINVPEQVDQAAISRTLNYDASIYGIKTMSLSNSNKTLTITYRTEETRTITINNKTLTYKSGSNIYLIRTLNSGSTFTTITTDSKSYSGKVFNKYVIGVSSGENIEVYDYSAPVANRVITFNVNEGMNIEESNCNSSGYSYNSSTSTCTKTISSNSTYGALINARRNGYTFAGWYTAKNGGSKITSSTKAPKTNITLYAHWVSN